MSFEDILKRGEQEIDELLHRDRRGGQPQTPAPGPVTLAAAPPQEAHSMFDIADIRNDIETGLGKLASLDTDAIAKVDAIKATPEGAEIFETLATLAKAAAGAVIPATVLPGLLSSVKSIGDIVQPWITQAEQSAQQAQQAPAEQASYAPAGPQVAGQA